MRQRERLTDATLSTMRFLISHHRYYSKETLETVELCFYARFYAPALARWFTPDPAAQFHNPYLAMANNPVRYTDPSGMTVPLYDEEAAGGGNNTSGNFEFPWNIEYGGIGGGSSYSNWGAGHGSYLLSNYSWANPYRSEESNRQFLSKNAYDKMYGYDHVNMNDKEAVWNKALALSVRYEEEWQIISDYYFAKPDGGYIAGVYGNFVWVPVWSPLGTPQEIGTNQSFQVDYPSRNSSDSFYSNAHLGLTIFGLSKALKMNLIRLLGGGELGGYGNLMRRVGQAGAATNIALSSIQYSNNEISGLKYTYDVGWSVLGTYGHPYAQAIYWSGVAGQYWGPSTWGVGVFGPNSNYGQFKSWINNR